jgi:hypothetical protein
MGFPIGRCGVSSNFYPRSQLVHVR